MILLFVVVISAFACTTTPDRENENRSEGMIHLQMGSNYLISGNIEMASFELNKAVRLIPKNADVHFAIGTIFLLKKEPELALEKFLKTIKLNPGHADAYNNMGAAYIILEKWDEAIVASQQAMAQISYETPEKALTIIGWSYYKKGDTGRALDNLKRALVIRSEQPDTENKLATIYLEEGRVDKAKKILIPLAKRIPDFSKARFNLGIAYFKESDKVAARDEFRAVIENGASGSEEVRLARGYLDLLE
jgi:type IV pilus biogenesis/stability protein PilW